MVLSFVKRFAVFLVFMIGVDCGLLILWGEVVPVKLRPNLLAPAQVYGYLDTRLKEAGEMPQVDVLFLGSSKAYRGLDPRVWADHGLSSFNLGSTGQTPLQTEVLLTRYLPRLRPRRIIFEVDPAPMMDEGVESSLDLLANGPVDLSALGMAWRINHLKTWNALVFAEWMQLSGRRNPRPEPSTMGPDRYVRGGFVEHEFALNQPKEIAPTNYAPRVRQARAMVRCLDLISREGIPYVLVKAPVTRALERSRKGMRRFAIEMRRNGPFLDMQDSLAYSETGDFYDPGHLNQAGVERFNEALLDTLERRGWLPQSITR